mgnify:CR=1 FL=1
MNGKLKLKRVCKKIKLYIVLPHIWVLFLVAILALIMCVLSVVYIEINTFLSSIFANIYAGLLTGVIICLITTIKSISLYRTESKVRWLENLHKECLKFISMHHKLLFSKEDEFADDESYYNYIYDTLCCGNDISQTISQGCFEEALPFNPYKYCKKKFSFDAVEVMNGNELLREEIIKLDVSTSSKTDIRELFKTMDSQIIILNRKIMKELELLQVKKKVINISIG